MNNYMSYVAAFCDVSNLYYCVNKKYEGRKLDYKKYWTEVEKYGKIISAFAYGTEFNEDSIKFFDCLSFLGFKIRSKQAEQVIIDGKPTLKRAKWDIAISMDIVRVVNKVHTVVIGSANPDLVHLVDWIKEKGAECIVLACGISKELKNSCDKYIEIKEALLED